MTAPNTSRRQLMQAGTALGITALAGCSQVTSLFGGGGGGAYSSWLPAPDELGDRDHYQFLFMRPAVWAEYEDELDDSLYGNFSDGLESTFSAASIDFDEMETVTIAANNNGVLTHQLSQEEIVENLEDADFDDDTDHEGYTIYLSPDERVAGGVAGSTLVWAEQGFSDSDPVDSVETLIDANIGNEDRYVEGNDDCGTLVDNLGSPSLVFGRTHEEYESTNPSEGEFDNQVATGAAMSLGQDTSTVTNVRVLESADDVDLDDADDWAEDDDQFDDLDDPTVSVNGRAIVVEGTIDTDDIGADQF